MSTADASATIDLLDDTEAIEPQSRLSRFGEIPVHIALLIIGLVVATPIIIALFMSFTPLPEIVQRANPRLLPDTWTLENYDKAWTASPFPRYVFNSFVQTGFITLGQVVFSVLAGYAFAMFNFRFKNALFALVIGSLIIPFELTFIPNFLLISDLGWTNTYQGLVVPFLASAFGVFMLRQFFTAKSTKPTINWYRNTCNKF